MLFLISCKTKFNPSEETYSIIPKEFSGKYSNDFYKATYETTSSNCIIYIRYDMYENKTYTKVIPIVFSHTYTNISSFSPYNKYSVNVYRYDTSDPDYIIYYFWTNEKSQRQLQSVPTHGASHWGDDYIHIDDINK